MMPSKRTELLTETAYMAPTSVAGIVPVLAESDMTLALRVNWPLLVATFAAGFGLAVCAQQEAARITIASSVFFMVSSPFSLQLWHISSNKTPQHDRTWEGPRSGHSRA